MKTYNRDGHKYQKYSRESGHENSQECYRCGCPWEQSEHHRCRETPYVDPSTLPVYQRPGQTTASHQVNPDWGVIVATLAIAGGLLALLHAMGKL